VILSWEKQKDTIAPRRMKLVVIPKKENKKEQFFIEITSRGHLRFSVVSDKIYLKLLAGKIAWQVT